MNLLEMKKKDAIAFFKKMLKENTQWALKGLTVIYQYQTNEEQAIGSTRDYNGVGFSGFDSPILSSLAQQVTAGRTLSPRQMAVVHRAMPKYAGQLYKVALAKAQAAAKQKEPIVNVQKEDTEINNLSVVTSFKHVDDSQLSA